MGNQAINWAWKLELPVTTKFVLIALCDQASDTTNSCFPGQDRIAKMIGGSQKTVERAMKDLEALNLIEREQRRTKQGWRTSDLYRVHVGNVLPDNLPTRQSAYQAESLVGNEPTRQPVPAYPTLSPVLPDSLSGQEELRSSEPQVNPKGEPPVLWPIQADPRPTPRPMTEDDLFEDWWTHVRRKVKKPKARAAYGKALKSIGGPATAAHAVLVAAIDEHQRHWFDLAGRSIDKTPHPTTWLNDQSWADELPDDAAYINRGNAAASETPTDRIVRMRNNAMAQLNGEANGNAAGMPRSAISARFS